MSRAALLLLALLALALLARRREPAAVAQTDWHGADAEGDALEPDPYLAGLLAVPDLERIGLLYWHTNSDGRVQPVIQPLPERKT